MTAQEAFIEECYRQYYDFLFKLCRRKIGNNRLYADLVDTCIQDTFLLAYQAYPKITQHVNLRAWLARTCLNRLLPYAKLHRKRMKHEAFSLDEEGAGQRLSASDSDIDGDRLDAQMLVGGIIQALTEKERLIFVDFFVEGFTVAEIARQRNLHTGTIKATIHSIRRKAKKAKKTEKFFSD